MMRRGSKGPEVVALQKALSREGFLLRPDGDFGPATEAAVLKVQRQWGLTPDGIAGPRTLEALAAPTRVEGRHPNMTAFLDMIAHAEGTDRIGDQRGYNVIVGGATFDDYSDHPNVSVWLPRYGIHSTAAGRYQILHRFWVHYKAQLALPDFGPDSQDRYAIQQIRERRAYDDIINGRIREAINKCRNIWASLPGAGYGQREVPADDLVAYYRQCGGMVA